MGFLCFNGFLVNRAGCCGNYIIPAVFLYLLFIVGGAFIIRQIEESNDKEIITEMRQLYQSFVANYSRNLNGWYQMFRQHLKLLQKYFINYRNRTSKTLERNVWLFEERRECRFIVE